MLKQIHGRICGTQEPWWRQNADEIGPPNEPNNIVPKTNAIKRDILADIDAHDYAAGRKQYIIDGKGKPPSPASPHLQRDRGHSRPLSKENPQEGADEVPHRENP